MADATTDDTLREMAAHRGLKLVKSRRRKPGTGDYGKFGLTDASGKALLGVGEDGLTASPGDIEAYLREGATSTWKASADATPARQPPADTPPRADPDETPAIRPRARRSAGKPVREAPAAVRDSKADDTEKAPVRSTRAGKKSDQLNAEPHVAAPVPEPAAEPELVFRTAKPGDAAALVPLLRQLIGVRIDQAGIARNLEAARRAKGGMVVAVLGDLIGCCSWAVIPTVQHGPVGRLTVLLVDEAHRRRVIGSALLDAATTALRKNGCTPIEAMSDIEIRNAHNFFRTLKFEQTSYRFARLIDES